MARTVEQQCDGFALAEYEALMAEIQAHLDEITQLYRFTTTAVVAVISWGITERNSLVLLTPPLLLLFSLLMMLSHSDSVFRIATYIRVVIEPCHPTTRWQTYLPQAATKRGRVEYLHNYAVGISYFSLATFSLSLAWLYTGPPMHLTSLIGKWPVYVVGIFCLTVAIVSVWRIALNRQAPDAAHSRIWEAIVLAESERTGPSDD